MAEQTDLPSSAPEPSSGEPHRLPVRTLVAASAGNAIEWYDWTIFATFSVFFASQIFPGDATAALISTFATYALAFFFRPLGGVLLGRFADLYGRRTSMLLTIVMMAGGSFVIGVLPTFELAGWFAPVLLLLARIAQGMSLGGEVSNASAYLAEIAPPERRGRYSAFFYISTGTAVLVATLMGALLTAVLDTQQLESWGWRLPFLLGGVLGLAALWLRRTMPETEQFESNREKARALRNPLLLTLREHPRAVGRLIGISLLNTLCYYTFFSALGPFAINPGGADANDVFVALSVGTVVFIALQYPMGAASDRFGRRPQMLVWAAAVAVVIVPLSTLVGPGLPGLMVVFVIGLGLYSLFSSIAPAVMSELFPTEVRGLGIGAWYNLTVAVFGGTAPLVIQTLSNAGRADWFFFYVAGGAAITFLVVLTMPETKGQVLR